MSRVIAHRHASRLAGVIASFVLTVLAPAAARAQGCVASRVDAPMGSSSCSAQDASKWDLNVTWRHYVSDRHFVFKDEQEERTRERTQVINDVHQVDFGIRRTFGPRWSLAVVVPYFTADRSSALRDPATREVVGRAHVQSSGIGDISVTGRRWMLDPAKSQRANFSLGMGLKLPTGKKDLQDVRERLTNDGPTFTRENVDQSVQPGDGGLGEIVELSGYVAGSGGHATFFGSATYLVNHEETDHVLTGRGRETEKYMSIADQYSARLGGIFTGPKWHGVALGAAGRIEGVPVHDLVGGSDHFRRPGWAVSFEPSITWAGKKHSISLAAPYALIRCREASKSDITVNGGRPGDAAFADYSLILGYGYRFGGGAAHATMPVDAPAAGAPHGG